MATDDNQQSNAGGAATNAGVEFQQRVAAWCLVIMHSASDPKALLDLPDTGAIAAVRFEAKSPIDDLVLVTERAGEIFIQMKRRVSLSEAVESDFVGSLRQFVSQYVAQGNTGYYVLAVPPDASSKIRNTLRKLIDALRLDPDAWKNNPLSKNDEECIMVYRAVVQRLFKDHAALTFDEPTFVAFSRRVFIREFAVTSGLGHETAALTLLGRDAKVAPELVWTYLIGQSLRFAAKRASVTRDNLGELIAPYFNAARPPAPELAMELAIKTRGRMPAGREVVLIEDFPKENVLAVMEFYRFDADGRRRLRFKGETVFWNDAEPNGSKLLYRSATMDGMQRLIEKNKSALAGREVYIVAANNIEEEVHSDFARTHAALLEKLASENPQLLKCVHCGKPLSQLWMTLVEVDDEDHPHAVGAVHDACLRPANRAIGQLQCPGFEGREYLKKFDVNRWIELRLHGQGAFNAGIGTRIGKPALIGWNPINEGFRENAYCIEVSLSDGTTRHITSRNSLDRFNLEEATKRAHFMDAQFKAAANLDPYCYTSVNFTFGPELLLLQMKEPDETLLECRETRVVPYTVALGRRYQSEVTFYSPLCRLVRADNEKPVLLRGCQLVVTDPFRLPDLIKTWQNAGLELPDYEIRILETDYAVDRWLSELFTAGEEPIIDPVCDRDGNLVGGFFVADVSNLRDPWN